MVLGYELIKSSELERILEALDRAIEQAESLKSQVEDSEHIIGELRQIYGLLAGQKERRKKQQVLGYATLAAAVAMPFVQVEYQHMRQPEARPIVCEFNQTVIDVANSHGFMINNSIVGLPPEMASASGEGNWGEATWTASVSTSSPDLDPARLAQAEVMDGTDAGVGLAAASGDFVLGEGRQGVDEDEIYERKRLEFEEEELAEQEHERLKEEQAEDLYTQRLIDERRGK
jgi:hypothetical protein